MPNWYVCEVGLVEWSFWFYQEKLFQAQWVYMVTLDG